MKKELFICPNSKGEECLNNYNQLCDHAFEHEFNHNCRKAGCSQTNKNCKCVPVSFDDFIKEEEMEV